MTNEVYRPPESELILETEARQDQFYVVSKPKVIVLYLSTLGLYTIYWFYINWRNYKLASGERLWPPIRSIFYIFFTHSLFNKVDAALKDKHLSHDWSPNLLATLFVLISIVSNILDRLSFREIGSPWTDVLSIAIIPLTLFIMLHAQESINISQADREGSSNSRFTLSNAFWILLGALIWLFIAIGLLDIFDIVSLDA